MENLSNISVVKNLLAKYGFTFSKSLGQNFIINPSVCPRMAELSGAGKGIGVIEVGPGFGVLTNELAKIADKVVCIELDKRLLPVLAETLSEYQNVKIINGDVMKLDLQNIIKEEFDGMEVVVCANLPYYITTPVIMRFLEEHLPISALTVMVQKEAARRICSPVGTRDCGAVTAAVNYYSEPKLLFDVSAGSFMPPPKVDSSVIRLDISDTPRVDVKDEKTFFAVVKSAFAQRRKTLPNTLCSGLPFTKAEINQILTDCDIPLTARAEQLTLQELAKISDKISEIKVSKNLEL